MSTPLTASWRLDFPYIVDGQTHHLRTYLSATPGAGPSGYDVVMRDGTPGTDMTAIVDAMYAQMQPFYPAGVASFGSAALENRSGTAWLPIAIVPTTKSPTGSGSYTKAGQDSWTLRDSAFHKIRHIWLESLDGPGQKNIPPGTGLVATVFLFFTTTPTAGSTNAHNWMRGRSDLYVSTAISHVTDLNDKIRRRRGIA